MNDTQTNQQSQNQQGGFPNWNIPTMPPWMMNPWMYYRGITNIVIYELGEL